MTLDKKILHFVGEDGKRIADVPIPAEWWVFFKRQARRKHMKVADWLERVLADYCERRLAMYRLTNSPVAEEQMRETSK